MVGLSLLVGNTQASTINLIENGGFETGDFTSWSIGVDTGGFSFLQMETGAPYTGTYSAKLRASGWNSWAKMSQVVDVSYLDELSFYTKTSGFGGTTCNVRAYIGTNVIWESTTDMGWTKVEIDTSSYSGVHNIEFRITCGAGGYTAYCWFDSIRATVDRDYKEIINPSFEKPIGNNPHIQWDSWTDVNTADAHSESAAQSTDYAHSGTHSLKLYASIDGSGSTAAGVTQKIDISSSTPYLNFRMFSGGAGGNAAIIVTIDDNNVWQYSSATTWDEFAVPLSGYNGVRDVSIYAIAQGASASNITAYIDTVSFGSLQEIVLKGKVYDAVTGGVLSGVVVDCSQMGGVATDTTDAMGNYEITGLFTNYDIYLDASKTDYEHHQTYFHFSNGGTKTINIYMLPYTEHGLYGLVIDHNGEAVPAASVKVWNTTWDDTTTTNSYGYFCFKNLTGLYEVQGSKAGMQASSIETITMEDIITTLDNCEAVTGWNSSGSVAINNTLKKQGSYSVRCNDTDVLLCNKTFSPAKNTNLTYGKLQFWAYIENSSAISTLEVSLIDGSTDYKKWTGLSGINGWNYFELWIPDASGTANLTDIVKFEVNATGSGEIVILFDEIRAFEPATDFVFLTLYGFFTLTVSAKNIDTAESIMSFTATLDGTETEGTTNGVVSFTQVVGGLHTVYVSAERYYGGTGSPFVWHNMTYAVYLLSTEAAGAEGGGAGVYYPPPHLVEFRVQNMWGKAYSDALVTASGYSTTMGGGTFDWLYSIFGFENETQIHNATMSDTTDSNGQLSFMMVETIKYRINVSDTESPARFDNKTFWIYPKDERYNLVVGSGLTWQKAGTEEQKEMSINVTTLIINDTHAYINVSYNDPSNQTTDLTIYVNQTINHNEEECLNSTNWVNTSVQNYSYIVTPYKGRAYKIQVVTEHEGWRSRTWTYAKRFEGMLIDLGLPDVAYPMIAVALLLFTGGIWGRSSATQGALVMCFEGWVFYAIGFLTMIPSATILSALALASVVSIIAIMMEKSRKTGVQ